MQKILMISICSLLVLSNGLTSSQAPISNTTSRAQQNTVKLFAGADAIYGLSTKSQSFTQVRTYATEDEDEDEDDDTDDYSKESYDMVVDYSFTTEDLGALYEQFTTCDVDSNQTLIQSELSDCFSAANFSNTTISFFMRIVDGIFGHEFDDEFLYFDEFCLLQQIFMSSYDYQLLWYFKVLDGDTDTYLSQDEFNCALELFPVLDGITFDSADLDEDDLISLEEFYEVMGGDYDKVPFTTSDNDDDETD